MEIVCENGYLVLKIAAVLGSIGSTYVEVSTYYTRKSQWGGLDEGYRDGLTRGMNMMQEG